VGRYEHLPIYKAALDVTLHFERVVAGFSRYHKYTLGTELRGLSREVVGLIVRVNSSRAGTRCRLVYRWIDGNVYRKSTDSVTTTA
jgi:hypothetical protein